MLIEADTHCHSVASTHAYSTIKELAQSASEIGLKAFAITDHGPASPDSPHIWHFRNLKCLPDTINGVSVLKGAEVNIVNYTGKIDLDENELLSLDWVIASMHTSVIAPAGIEEHSEAYIKLAWNPYVDVIGHCTTSKFPFKYEKVLRVFKECGKMVEINESSLLSEKSSAATVRDILLSCKRWEIPIVVNSDCHYCELIGKVDRCARLIEETGFPERLIVNARMDRLIEYIDNKRKLKSLGL